MKQYSKKFLAMLMAMLVVVSVFALIPTSVAAESKNLITNSTKIKLLHFDEKAKMEDLFTWKDGVVTSLNKEDEGANMVFDIEGLDNTKTYRFAGKLKIMEFNSDTGWYGPRVIFRGQDRQDIENTDYSALCHFQNTDVFINNFINATTLPYEVAHVRAKLNTEMDFEIYVSPERTVIYYAGQKRLDVKNNARVQKLPYSFGFWSIGCTASFYDLSLTEAEMPAAEVTTTKGAATTTKGAVTTTKAAGTTTSKKDGGAVTTTTAAPADGTTTAGGDVTTTTDVADTNSASTTADSGSAAVTTTTTTAALTGGDADADGGTPAWLVPVIIVVVVLIAAAAALFYFMVLRKKK